MSRQIFLTIGLLMITISVFGQSKLTPKQISKGNYQEIIGDLTNSKDTIVPDKYAMYPNGIKGILRHISRYLTYPPKAAAKGIQGTVMLGFVVEKDGTINEIELIQGIDLELNAEAIRVLKKLKTWIPAYRDGKPVRVAYTLPFNFKLE